MPELMFRVELNLINNFSIWKYFKKVDIFVKVSASMFSFLGICTRLHASNYLDNSCIAFRYPTNFFILHFIQPFTCLADNWESEWMITHVALTSRDALSPANTASYSSSLLETLNSNIIAILIFFLEGKTKITPLPSLLSAPSTFTFHTSSHLVCLISTKKSDSVWALIAVLCWYSMSYYHSFKVIWQVAQICRATSRSYPMNYWWSQW